MTIIENQRITPKSDNDNILEMIADGDMCAASQLVAYGGLNYVRDSNLNTALHVAAKNGHSEIVKYLVENGADTKVNNKFGETPYQLALINDHDHTARNTDISDSKVVIAQEEAVYTSQRYAPADSQYPSIAISLIESEPSIRYALSSLLGIDINVPYYHNYYKTAAHFIFSNLESYNSGVYNLAYPLYSTGTYITKGWLANMSGKADSQKEFFENCGYNILGNIALSSAKDIFLGEGVSIVDAFSVSARSAVNCYLSAHPKIDKGDIAIANTIRYAADAYSIYYFVNKFNMNFFNDDSLFSKVKNALLLINIVSFVDYSAKIFTSDLDSLYDSFFTKNIVTDEI